MRTASRIWACNGLVVVGLALGCGQRAKDEARPSPASLAGTDEDGALRVDDRGDLVLGPGVVRLFTYYFTATGEEQDETIRARIVAAIRRKLSGHGRAAAQAEELFDRFLAYRAASRALPRADGDAARLAQLRQLRVAHFGVAGAERLFEGSQLASAAARADVLGPLREHEEERALRASGASPEQVRAHRVATAGEAASERLRALDERRAEWNRRLVAFEAARRAVLRDDPAGDAKVKRLLEDSFTPEERLRVR